MEEIINKIQNKLVEDRNTLRFSLSHMIEKAIKDSLQVDSCMFLKILFNTSVSEGVEIHTKVNKGESFTDVMNNIINKRIKSKQ